MPTAAILAGGQARRFGGRDKSGLVLGGRSILERQLEELARVSNDVLIVGSASGLEELPFVPSGTVVRRIPDRIPGRGPLGGLETALTSAHEDLLVVVACDMPYVEASFLNYLVSLADGCDAVVPKTGHGPHPLCAVYGRHCLDAVRDQLAAGRLSMKTLLLRLEVRYVLERELDRFGGAKRLLANVNTPGELAEVVEAAEHEVSS